ncbi:MAG TPA: carbohydrate binding domain-containing protein [Verrucomicrobiae bacterium]|jgi:tetratricopeptide (TPR) repeat protein|nr:carbohydrate binding domain-containing protein [Verrucomicrobiae bacterium]
MTISLGSPSRKLLITAIAVLCLGVYFALAARELAADWLGNRVELKSLQWAARLDPGNADYRNHLGRYYDLVVRDPAAALSYYKAAVQLNPHSARYWFDLASAYQVLGDVANQTFALERAIQADSMTPDVAWEAANLYLVQGQNEKALREYSVVMANDASLAATAIQFCWRIDPDVDSLLRDVVPHNAAAYIALLSLLENKGNTDGSMKVWDALVRSGEPYEARDAFDYIHYLILNKQVDEAVSAWNAATVRFHYTSYRPSANNLIVNPMFNLDVLNAGFDWQYQKQSGITLTLDPSEFRAGRRSLLIGFDGPGIHDAGFYQFVVVQPNTTYEFSAYYKNGDIEGAGGPHLTIQDMYTQAVYFDSDELKEAAGFWKSIDGEFTTGPDCKLVVLHIRRIPEGSPIRGKLWIDDFHLRQKRS